MLSGMTLNHGYTYRSRIRPADEGLTLLEYLARHYTHSSAATWQERLSVGEVQLDAAPAGGSERLQRGQTVLWQRPPWREEAVPLHYEVVYQDAHLLAVNKPSGLPTMPAGGFLEHTLLTLVRRDYPSASALHRLGRGTSGLVLFGLKASSRAEVSQQWRAHEVSKTYLALSSGVAQHHEYTITTPIGPVPHPKLGQVEAANPNGKTALSVARVQERRADSTLFAVQIATGRPHQIRIHLANIGLPLLGDPLYAAGGLPYPDSAALVSDLGYFLHAWKLAFQNPATGQRLALEAEPPQWASATYG